MRQRQGIPVDAVAARRQAGWVVATATITATITAAIAATASYGAISATVADVVTVPAIEGGAAWFCASGITTSTIIDSRCSNGQVRRRPAATGHR
jgi:uncharacterized protein (DUF433 family)